MRHFADDFSRTVLAAGAAMSLLLTGCDKLSPQGGNPTMTMLHDGSEKVCIASDVQKALRDLIVPKPADTEQTAALETRVSAAAGVSLGYEQTTLQSFDRGVSKASCSTTVAIRGTGNDKAGKFRIDYAVSPAADNSGSFVITANVDDAHAFANGLVTRAVEDASTAAEDEFLADEEEKQKQQLLAVINEKWLQGAWIGSNAASAGCGNGQAIWFEPSHVLEGAWGKGRWSLTADQLHIVGGEVQSFDLTGSITQADPISFTVELKAGDPTSLRRCTRAETETLPQPTPEGSAAE